MWSTARGPSGQTLLSLPYGPLRPFMSLLRGHTAPLGRHSMTKVSIEYRSYTIAKRVFSRVRKNEVQNDSDHELFE